MTPEDISSMQQAVQTWPQAGAIIGVAFAFAAVLIALFWSVR